MKLNFYSSLLIITAASLAAHYFIFEQIEMAWNIWIWMLYIYFPSLSLIIYRLLSSQVDGRPQSFVTLFMGSMAAKLFFSLILLLMVVYFNRDIKVPFAISFLFLYLLYTTLNTVFIFGKLRGK